MRDRGRLICSKVRGRKCRRKSATNQLGVKIVSRPTRLLSQRTKKLKSHLQQENPLLVEVVSYFEQLDRVGYKTGLLDTNESFANSISWWPLVSILGTFSAGKSTFINNYLGVPIQQTGNQAVDDKFSVMTYSGDDEVRVLPGLALDADPRFPFYQISEEIEAVSEGEGSKVDSYLQLKTCHSEQLRGKILIDSPGFDADAQRNTILRITDHIIDLSDLVLVFFDARHPEPGAMQDTLEHLVRGTIDRNDANKFVFVLNQIDTTAREDNLEEVVAAWQKAIVQTGLSAGTFYCIYNDSAVVPIEDETVRGRYEARKSRDMAAIQGRIDKVGVERAYRIIGALENMANRIEQHQVPKLVGLLRRWRKRVVVYDLLMVAALLGGVATWAVASGYWGTLVSLEIWQVMLSDKPVMFWGIVGGAIGIIALLHYLIRRGVALRMVKRLRRTGMDAGVISAFKKNTRFWRCLLRRKPVGWGRFAKKRIANIREAADRFVQSLNDEFTDPSGKSG